MDRYTIINVLERIALLLELKGENPFKIQAYRKAAQTLENLKDDPITLIRNGEIVRLKGIGKTLHAKLVELVTTGKLVYFDNLKAEFPETLFELLELPGIGHKKLRQLYQNLSISSIVALEQACHDQRISKLAGFGKKSAQSLLSLIQRHRENQSHLLYSQAKKIAADLRQQIAQFDSTHQIEISGDLRRMSNWISRILLVASSDLPDRAIKQFLSLEHIDTILARSKNKTTVKFKSQGCPVELIVVPASRFVQCLYETSATKAYLTAFQDHATAEGRLDASVRYTTEKDLFRTVHLAFIPPEMREDPESIRYAKNNNFDFLVQETDYKGVLHCHSQASDGKESISDLIAYAHARKHQYIGITDHSRSSVQANGLTEERLIEQIQMIHGFKKSLPVDFNLFSAIECDVLKDGSLDYDHYILEQLDYVIISVHSAFSLSKEEMTRRLIRAIENPLSRILAHPTGRLLLKRQPYDIDLDKIIDAAAANNVAIEFNCHPYRLDMDWYHWKRAKEKGVFCSLNPDVHQLSHFDSIAPGIRFCRKGWLAAEDIINCWSAEKLRDFFKH